MWVLVEYSSRMMSESVVDAHTISCSFSLFSLGTLKVSTVMEATLQKRITGSTPTSWDFPVALCSRSVLVQSSASSQSAAGHKSNPRSHNHHRNCSEDTRDVLHRRWVSPSSPLDSRKRPQSWCHRELHWDHAFEKLSSQKQPSAAKQNTSFNFPNS